MNVEKSLRYDIYQKKLTTFANQMLQAYEKTNILQHICTVKEFDNQKKEFFQIAKRERLPKEFFFEPDDVDNSILARDFVRAIVMGEQDFLLKELLESEKVPRCEAKSFNYEEITRILSKINYPTDIFIPIKPYFTSFYGWASGNREQISFEHTRDPLLIVRNKKIQVHWITSKSYIKDIVVLDRNNICIIQKTYEQSEIPKGITPIPEFSYFSENKKLMLYLADKDEENFDFIFRAVISKLGIIEGAAMIIDVRNKPEG